MATNYVSDRTAQRLRLTLAKRIADVSSELGDECKRHCLGIRYDKANDEMSWNLAAQWMKEAKIQVVCWE